MHVNRSVRNGDVGITERHDRSIGRYLQHLDRILANSWAALVVAHVLAGMAVALLLTSSRSIRAHAGPDADFEYLFEMKGTAPYGRVTHPGAMAATSDGTIYVLDAEDHRVTRFDHDGNVISAWGAFGQADGHFFAPADLAVAPDGTVYVSDSGNFRIQRFTADGTHLVTWGREGTDAGAFTSRHGLYESFGPGSLTVDNSGRVHVDDPGAKRIQVFSADGAYLWEWFYPVEGARASYTQIVALRAEPSGMILALIEAWHEARSERMIILRRYDVAGALRDEWELTADLSGADGMAVSADGTIYVSHQIGSPSVLRYSPDGELLATWGEWVDPEARRMIWPVGIAVAPDGGVFVGDINRRRVQRFTADGTFEATWADGPPAPGQTWPIALARAPNNDFYVAVREDHVHRFNSRGELLNTWSGDGKTAGEFHGLRDLAIGSSGRVYTIEQSEHRVQVFEPDGTSVIAWGEEGTEPGQLFYPRELIVTPAEELLVYESHPNRIQRWSAAGESLGIWLEPIYPSDLDIVPGAGSAEYEVLSLENGCLVRRSSDASEIARLDVYPDRSVMSCFYEGLRPPPPETARHPRRGIGREVDTGIRGVHDVLSIPVGARAVAPAIDGSFIVSTDSEIRHLGSTGALLSTQGVRGRQRGEFLDAQDLIVMPVDLDPDGPIPPGAAVIADLENSRLQVFGRRRELWRAELFDNPWLMGYPAHITTTGELNLDWSATRPSLVAPAERFSARFDRWMSLSGTIRIDLQTRGGARLWAGNALVVDEWYADAIDTARYLTLPDGDHLVRLELNGTAGEAAVRLDLAAGDFPAPTATVPGTVAPTRSTPAIPSPDATRMSTPAVYVPFARR